LGPELGSVGEKGGAGDEQTVQEHDADDGGLEQLEFALDEQDECEDCLDYVVERDDDQVADALVQSVSERDETQAAHLSAIQRELLSTKLGDVLERDDRDKGHCKRSDEPGDADVDSRINV
jgi:hypothetical protein